MILAQKKIFIPLLLLFFFFICLSLSELAFSQDVTLNTAKLEELTKNGLAGKNYELRTQKKKKLILFWATWCSTCKHKLTSLLPTYNEKKDLEVLTINIDDQGQLGRVKHYLDKNNIKLTVLRDQDGSFIKSLNVTTAPHWALYQYNEKTKIFDLIKQEVAFDEAKINSFL